MNPIRFPNEIGGMLPSCFVQTSQDEAIMCTLSIHLDSCLVQMILSTGKILNIRCFHDLVISNIAYDNILNQFFFNGYNMSLSKNFIFSLDIPSMDKAPPIVILYIPGIVQVCINSYSSVLHYFFLTLQIRGSDNNVVVVDVLNKKIVANSFIAPGIEILVFDDGNKVLYAWVATEVYAGLLVSIDYMNGKVLNNYVGSEDLSSNGGVAVFDSRNKVMYTSLLDFMHYEDPYWTKVDISKYPNCTLEKNEIGEDVTYPWFMGLILS